jgi:hypothetical protein
MAAIDIGNSVGTGQPSGVSVVVAVRVSVSDGGGLSVAVDVALGVSVDVGVDVAESLVVCVREAVVLGPGVRLGTGLRVRRGAGVRLGGTGLVGISPAEQPARIRASHSAIDSTDKQLSFFTGWLSVPPRQGKATTRS